MDNVSFEQICRMAGLRDVSAAHVGIGHVKIPFLPAPLPTDPSGAPLSFQTGILPAGSGQGGSPSDTLSLFYFFEPGCEICEDDLETLSQMSPNGDLATNFKFFAISYKTDITSDIKKLQLDRHLSFPIYHDVNGALAEKLAALGSPALYVTNENGFVLAHNNGPLEFSSIGFQLFVAAVQKRMFDFDSPQSVYTTETLADAKTQKQPLPVSFLKDSVSSSLLLGALLLVCYAFAQSIRSQLKKHSRGPKCS